ncbi:MAG TPA: MBL fold metallo-hydrolase [Candidatus Acidoferrales bacterium]|nr:MBL fold metallo-hydrolase [Candidatus Acidoferrales bacterium]HEV2340499.1 MBL fold metallo-hydrolase [Candidatus Acidoferrales bacterium]
MRLKSLKLLLSIFALACVAAAADTPAPFTLHEVASGVWAAIDNPAVKAARSGANAGFIIGSDSVAVVDTFENPAAAQALLDEIRKKTNLPIRFVVNTHYHIDHVAGNNVFAAAGATILAQDNVRAWERTENLKFFGPQIKPEQRQMVEFLGLPTVTYKDGVDLYLGTRHVVVVSLPGHTGGDSVVFVPDANVVFCGDLFWKHTLPNLIDASTKSWIDSLDAILSDHPEATFVPGHGEVGRAQDVRDFREYLFTLREAVGRAQSASKSDDALIDDVLAKLQAKYAGWDAFQHFAKRDIQFTDEELRGKKKIPQPPAN